ncbi:acetyl-CoA carboxylase biotin carboxyl carrier protein [Enterococcus sp. LJL99]
MNIQEVKELLTQFDQSTVNEFELKEGSFALYMNKNKLSQKSVSNPVPNVATVTETIVQEPSIPTSSIVTEEKTTPVTTETKPSGNTEDIVSPIVGIVYLKPAPDQDNFKKIGDTVKKGEIICIVEAMKLMNEITATVDGVITEVLVSNEEVVEFNQPLFRVSKGE